MGSIDHIKNDPDVRYSIKDAHKKRYYNLSAETDPVRKQELTNLYLNEDMNRKELQQKGSPPCYCVVNKFVQKSGIEGTQKEISDKIIDKYNKARKKHIKNRLSFLNKKNSKIKQKISINDQRA